MKALGSTLKGTKLAAPGGIEETVAKLYLRLFPKTRFRIYSMLARLIGADIDARTALEFVYDVLSNDGRNKGEFSAVAVGHWVRAYREHGRISEALTGWVPQTEILLLEAGERSGKFEESLAVMLRLNEKASAIRGVIAGKLIYPVAVLTLLLGVLYYLSTELLPQLIAVKGGAGLFTGSAATMVGAAQWISAWLIPTGIGVLIAVAAVIVSMPYFRGPVRDVLDKLPPWSIHRFISGTSFLSGILVLMESGRNLVDAVALVRPNTSPYMDAKIAVIEAALREGLSLGEALSGSVDQFPDSELVKEIQIFGRVGRLDEGLLSVVEQWMVTATERTRAQIAFVSMLILAASAALIGFSFTGLYDLVGQLKQG